MLKYVAAWYGSGGGGGHLAARCTALEHSRAVAAGRAKGVRGGDLGHDGEVVVAVRAEELVVVPYEQSQERRLRGGGSAPLIRLRAGLAVALLHTAGLHVEVRGAVAGGEENG